MLITGLVLIMVSLLGMSQLDANSAYVPDVLVPFLLLGLGAGLAFLPLMTLAMADVPNTDAGLASGIVNASLQISAAIGIAALGTIATDRAQSDLHEGSGLGHALTAGYTLAWELGALTRRWPGSWSRRRCCGGPATAADCGDARARQRWRRLSVASAARAALERVADEPEHRRPQAHEQGAPLGVAALVLVDGLGADPQSDAEIDARERGCVVVPVTQPGAIESLGQHARALPG